MLIELYTRDGCEYCEKTKELLENKLLNYNENIIGKTINREDVLKKFPGRKLLPIVVINGNLIGGYTETKKFFNACGKYDRDELITILGASICKVYFTKKNGEEKIMKCTLLNNIIPEENKSKNVKKSNPEVLPVWDIDKSAWRSFRVDSVKNVEVQ